MKKFFYRTMSAVALALFLVIRPCWGTTLQEVLDRGELRHLGIPYARFVTGSGDGLDVELMEKFAQYLNVSYRYVQFNWDDAIPDLLGRKISVIKDQVTLGEEWPCRGDVLASGFTMMKWREEILSFSSPTFPSQIWLVAPYNHRERPIDPCGSLSDDIQRTIDMVDGMTVMGLRDTCLDPRIYGLEEKGAKVILFDGGINDLVPAMIKGESDLLILDVPDALMSLTHWQGRIKILGPISPVQSMAAAFSPDGESLRIKFEDFYGQIKDNGEYMKMVLKYYPTLFEHFPCFLKSGE